MNLHFLIPQSKSSSIKTLGFLLLFALPFWGIGQTPAERLQSMQQLYAQHSSFSMQVAVKVYVNGAPQSAPITGSAKKQGQQFYSQIGERENLINEHCIVMVNHEHKSLIYGPALEAKTAQNWTVDPVEQAKAWKEIPMEFMKDSEGNQRIRLLQAGQPLASTEILLGNDGRLLALTYNYSATESSGPMRVEITYSHLDFNPRFDKSTFSEKRFIKGSGERAQPTANYPNYQIFNQFSR